MTLFADDFDHFAPFITAAVRANAMRQLGLMAVGALGDRNGFQMIVSTAC